MLCATDLDAFTLAYVTAALWSENDESNESGGEPLDQNYSVENIAPETLAEMAADCAAFQKDNADLLIAADYGAAGERGGYREMAGHDFWLTRNGHGAGFWDRDLGKVGDDLTDEAHAFGNYSLYVGDDGLIYGAKG